MNTTQVAQLNWENVPQASGGHMERVRTPTGWLVRETHDVLKKHPHESIGASGYEWRSSITFVPDPDHSWLAMDPAVTKLECYERMHCGECEVCEKNGWSQGQPE